MRPQTTDHRPQTTDHRPQTTDHRPQTTDHRPQTTDHRPQTTDHRPQTTDHRPQTTDHRPQTTDHRLASYNIKTPINLLPAIISSSSVATTRAKPFVEPDGIDLKFRGTVGDGSGIESIKISKKKRDFLKQVTLNKVVNFFKIMLQMTAYKGGFYV